MFLQRQGRTRKAVRLQHVRSPPCNDTVRMVEPSRMSADGAPLVICVSHQTGSLKYSDTSPSISGSQGGIKEYQGHNGMCNVFVGFTVKKVVRA